MKCKEQVVRKKLYKSGKNFVVASIFSLFALGSLMTAGLQAKADTVNGQDPAVKQLANDKDQQSSVEPQNKDTQAVADQQKTDQTSDQTDQTAADQTTSPALEKQNGPSDSKSAAGSPAENNSDEHVKEINGEKYYLDDKGTAKKNFAVNINGQVHYFNKDNGAESPTDQYQFKQVLTERSDDFNKHNAANSTSTQDFSNVDGYLTADSWYRPKEILANGDQWQKSGDKDFRPLLTNWWPDKETQVNYLNYMKKSGLSDAADDFSGEQDQSYLDQAAEQVQTKIEQKIGRDKQTDWLKNTVDQFVDSQSNWNINSESQTTGDNKDHLQGGALLYVNSDKTPEANSDFRLLNRTPTNQTGKPLYHLDPTQGGYDFLLANDVDNSNPVVQAEQLNWMYYLLNFGSITNHDKDADFDSIRVDAVDNVDADLLQIASDYFKAAYRVNKNDAAANKHLSILEDWSDNDSEYVKDHGDNQLSMDNKLRLSLKYSLTMPYHDSKGNQIRSGLEPLVTNSLVDRSNDDLKNGARPNYSFIRAHDSEVQTVIADIIKQRIDPASDGLVPTQAQLDAAFKIYKEDQLKSSKEFTQYNIPSAYALLLTNKDTVPRVYYGDLFTDDGDYMAEKSPYYDAIDNLLRSRIKYVSGGQKMAVQYMQGDQSMAKNSYRGLLTSVRYGENAFTESDKGDQKTRNEGLAVIESNDPTLKLNKNDNLVVNMGAAHKNQMYRPELLSTIDGLQSYHNDDVPNELIKKTNENGQLIFGPSEIFGISDPQVSGYLSVWVPVGAQDDQDVRVAASKDRNRDGKTLHSNASLDSEVIYEAFSNFQSIPQENDRFMNLIIPKHLNLFNDWGITNFELPPQYRSSDDNSFLDSIIKNGYAFTDRYDLGFNKPTKYGTVDQLRNAIKALHSAGIKVMADWVPDQIYDLKGKQVVTARRVNDSGIYDQDSVIDDSLYAAQIKGGGDYQAIYGGAFLNKIKALYPWLFKVRQISTGLPMNPNEKIKQWSAKYFNGSNIQGRGAYYVLKDWGSDQYFKLSSAEDRSAFLPKQLLGRSALTGFYYDQKGMVYYSNSGYQAKDTFIQDEKGNWYYFAPDGYMKFGFQEIKGSRYYFLPNGIELQDALFEDDQGKEYYFNQRGRQYMNGYFMDENQRWRYFDKDGVMARGLAVVEFNGQKQLQYFADDGFQVKGQAVLCSDGKLRYFDPASGNMVSDRFEQISDGVWAYFGSDGTVAAGLQNINGKKMFFDDENHQIKGREIKAADGKLYFFDADSGEMITNRFERLSDGNWYYFTSDGSAAVGTIDIDGKKMHFDEQGRQTKGEMVNDEDGYKYYYDGDTGELAKARFGKTADNTWSYFDGQGHAVTGAQFINGQHLFFLDNGQQIKGHEYTDENGKMRYFDADSGEMITNRFERLSDNTWAYFNEQGISVTGAQFINGQHLYFLPDGRQVKGRSVVDDSGRSRYYDADDGGLAKE